MTNDKSDPVAQFEAEKAARIASYPADDVFQELSLKWATEAFQKKYMYNFHVMGRPIIQLPADIVVMSELIWELRPDLIVEMGIAHGGSIIHSATQLALLDICDAIEKNKTLDPSKPSRKVVAVDIDIRAHNRRALEEHPMSNRIHMVEGSSLDQAVIEEVYKLADNAERVLVVLDSNHTHDHVLGELRAYAPLTTPESYCVVFDTIIEDLPEGFFPNREWNQGNSPRTAISAYLNECNSSALKDKNGKPLHFSVDMSISDKLVITAAPGGFLRRNSC